MLFKQMDQERVELTPHRFAVPFGQPLDLLNEGIQVDLFEPMLPQELSRLIGPSDKICLV